MNYFTILTRGRTGSTAVIDYLNRVPNVACYQELFKYSPGLKQEIKDIINSELGVSGKVNFETKVIDKQPLDYDFYSNYFGKDITKYLDYLMEYSNRKKLFFVKNNKNFIGFKLLFNHLEHFSNSENLLQILVNNGCKFLILRRKNPLKEALSGVIASNRGTFNINKKTEKEKFNNFKKNIFNKKIKISSKQVADEVAYIEYNYPIFEKILLDSSASYKYIYYEDLLYNKDKFIRDVCHFIGCDSKFNLFENNYVKITPDDLSNIIENYDEFVREIREVHQIEYEL